MKFLSERYKDIVRIVSRKKFDKQDESLDAAHYVFLEMYRELLKRPEQFKRVSESNRNFNNMVNKRFLNYCKRESRFYDRNVPLTEAVIDND